MVLKFYVTLYDVYGVYIWGLYMGKIKETVNFFKAIWKGEKFPTEQGKFRFICAFFGLVHIGFLIYFLAIGYMFVGLYNVFAAVYFFINTIVIKKNDDFLGIFIGTFAEVTLFSAMVTILCGWNMGFMLYVIALCPVSFFVSYVIPGRKTAFTGPFIFSAILLVIFVGTKFFIDIKGPIFLKNIHPKAVLLIYNINCIVIFIFIFVMSAFFALEIRAKERELEKQNIELADISSIDPLTKLLNRRTMDICLEEAVKKVKSSGELFTLAIGDIDNFKKVNDVYGHNVGDDVLVMVAKTIRQTLPDKGILCRWGGEEFLILIRDTEENTIPIIEKVRDAVSKQRVLVERQEGDMELGVTMTYGVCQYIHGFSIEKVISIADDNLYIGKENGKNRVVHSQTKI